MRTLSVLILALIAVCAAQNLENRRPVRYVGNEQNYHPLFIRANRVGNAPQNWIKDDNDDSEPCDHDDEEPNAAISMDNDLNDTHEDGDDDESDTDEDNDIDTPSSSSALHLNNNGAMRIEAHLSFDEETGEPTIVIPEEALANIPKGAVLALYADESAAESLGRANKRVVVRKTRKGGRRGNRRGNRRVVRRGNRRRPIRRRRPVRVVRRGGQRRPAYIRN